MVRGEPVNPTNTLLELRKTLESRIRATKLQCARTKMGCFRTERTEQLPTQSLLWGTLHVCVCVCVCWWGVKGGQGGQNMRHCVTPQPIAYPEGGGDPADRIKKAFVRRFLH